MINASTLFQNTIKERTNFIQAATITFRDGRVVNLGQKDFAISNNNVNDGANANGLPLGVAISRSIKLEIANFENQYSDYDFNEAKISLSCSLELENNKTETIEYGLFTVITPETYGDTIIVTAVDDMYKCDKPYETNLAFPNRLDIILQDIASRRGFLIKKENFTNCDFMVMSKPTNVTDRQVIGYIAMIAGGNARFDRYGYLEILTYDREKLSIVEAIIDGGTYLFTDGSEIDGGDFTYNTGANIDGGSFEFASDNYHVLSSWKNLKVDVDDVVITGIQTNASVNKDNEEKTKLYGENGYVLNINNPLIIKKEEEAIKLIGDLIIGMKFRSFSGDYISYPLAEFMDLCVINDRKGNSYPSIITDVNFSFGGFTRLKNTAVSAIRNSSSYFSNATQAIVEASKMVEKEKSEREVAQDLLFQQLSNANGMYYTEYEAGDGSIIRFLHDKPKLDDSQIVWKFTIDAFGISTDGGETYPYGMDISGTAILEKLYASKISADYINGGILRLGGINNINGQIYIYDNEGVQCGVINNIGISIYSAINKKRVIISPLIGFREQTVENGDFIGLTFQTTTYCERSTDIIATSEYQVKHYDYFKNELVDSYVETGDYVNVTYYKWKYWYEHSGYQSAPVWYEENIQKVSNICLERAIQLPDEFKGKSFVVSAELVGVNTERANSLSYKVIKVKSRYGNNQYYEKTGKTWISDWTAYDFSGVENNAYDQAKSYQGVLKTLEKPEEGEFTYNMGLSTSSAVVNDIAIRNDYENAIIYVKVDTSVNCSSKNRSVVCEVPDIFDIKVTAIC